jgi:hypothetical protein
MTRNIMLIFAGLLVGAAIGVPTATANANALSQCLFNDECDGTLVCSGLYCRSLCRSDKDCDAGERCLAGGTDYAACEAIPKPVAPGVIHGRVERAFGVPVRSCEVRIVGGATTQCGAGGEFSFIGIAPGRYELRVRALNQGVGPRTIIARVSAGVAGSVGAIHLPSLATELPPTIDPSVSPLVPVHEDDGKGKGKGKAKPASDDDGGKSNAEPKK